MLAAMTGHTGSQRCPMSLSRLSLLFSGLVWGLTWTGAGAQTAQSDAAALLPTPAPALKDPAKDVRVQTDAWFKDCKHGWDAATHMTRKDYERTCLRMAQERVKFMRDWEKTGGEPTKAR